MAAEMSVIGIPTGKGSMKVKAATHSGFLYSSWKYFI
jgi:hypothetical protein